MNMRVLGGTVYKEGWKKYRNECCFVAQEMKMRLFPFHFGVPF